MERFTSILGQLGSSSASSASALSTMLGSLTVLRQDLPQPLKQHFCSPSQSASDEQSSWQVAYEFSLINLGQTPTFFSNRQIAL